MKSTRTILFIFHEAKRTGASVVLLRYVKLLKEQTDYKLVFLLLEGGPLMNQLAEQGTVIFWRKNVWRNRLTLLYLRFLSVNLILANTIATFDYLTLLKRRLKCPTIWYIHELGLSAKILSQKTFNELSDVDIWMANSISTKNYLRQRFGIGEEKCVVNYPPVILPQAGQASTTAMSWKGKFVVGSAGTAIARKGHDLFILLAYQIKKRKPENNFHFVWVGDHSRVKNEIAHDLEKCGLTSCVEFVGEVDNPFEYYQHFDVFVSTSKEESFGLACAEAAALGIPVVGFKDTMGLEEVIQDCAGTLIPYMDIEGMADKLIEMSATTTASNKSAFESGGKFSEMVLMESWKSSIGKAMSVYDA